MAEYSFHTERTERIVYTLRLPTNWAEVAKMGAAVNEELTTRCMPRTDDAVIVECDDEYLRRDRDQPMTPHTEHVTIYCRCGRLARHYLARTRRRYCDECWAEVGR